MILVVALFDAAGAATHCGPDGTSVVPSNLSMSTVISSASTRAEPATAEKTDKQPVAKSQVAQTNVSNPATAGGGVAGGGGEDGGGIGDGSPAPSALHKRGVRWQSFLPGVIR